jgi:hypothetical protein
MRSRRSRISRRQMLESVPRLNPAVRWEELDTGRILVTFRKDAGVWLRIAMRLFALPEWSQVLLDEVGTRVVRQIDGVRTVNQLIAYLAGELKLSRKEAEVALVKYLEMLGKRNLVGFEVRPAGEEP